MYDPVGFMYSSFASNRSSPSALPISASPTTGVPPSPRVGIDPASLKGMAAAYPATSSDAPCAVYSASRGPPQSRHSRVFMSGAWSAPHAPQRRLTWCIYAVLAYVVEVDVVS